MALLLGSLAVCLWDVRYGGMCHHSPHLVEGAGATLQKLLFNDPTGRYFFRADSLALDPDGDLEVR